MISRGATTICCNGAQLQDAIRRVKSASVELEVSTDVLADDGRWEIPSECYRHVHIRVVRLTGRERISENLLAQPFIRFSISTTQELSLPTCRFISGQIDLRLDKVAHNLRKLELQAKQISILADHDARWKENITNLTVCNIAWPTCSSSPIHFSRLESLTFGGNISHFHVLHLPALRSLSVLESPTQCSAHPWSSSTIRKQFPALQTIKVEDADSGWLTALDLPVLRVFTLEQMYRDAIKREVRSLRLPPSPVERINIQVGDHRLFTQESLRAMPLLKHVVFEMWGELSWEKDVLAMFFEAGDIPCPHLEWIQFPKARPYDAALANYIADILRSIEALGLSSLRFIAIHWSDQGFIRYWREL
ncbi:hypothetical protein PIIN_09943 [Serendipita indica DSM 11827]|uniref:F-box domain-containing protein n=1 Tax=Serendipita indica (strain DSM 11827) TaxID=1109443 RepID=G4TXA4_SERID|nr:hypothetical protein PIIN_09943 [Serendipita indica DSM 11827]